MALPNYLRKFMNPRMQGGQGVAGFAQRQNAQQQAAHRFAQRPPIHATPPGRIVPDSPSTPIGAIGPAVPVAPKPKVYFNPLSKTLYSAEDGSDYNVADPASVDFMDGSLLNSSMAKEASFFLNQGHGQYQLDQALRPYQQQLDRLSDQDPTTHKTLYDVLSGQAQDQWQHKADAAMSSAAQRGIYDSGMRQDMGGQLATERSNVMSDLDKAYGATAISNLQKQKSDARDAWVGDWLNQFTPYYNNLLSEQAQNDIIGGTTPGDATNAAHAAEGTSKWTPESGMKIGAPVPSGGKFAGRQKLSNGLFAPLVSKGGKTMIEPSWQKFMKANNVKAAN